MTHEGWYAIKHRNHTNQNEQFLIIFSFSLTVKRFSEEYAQQVLQSKQITLKLLPLLFSFMFMIYQQNPDGLITAYICALLSQKRSKFVLVTWIVTPIGNCGNDSSVTND